MWKKIAKSADFVIFDDHRGNEMHFWSARPTMPNLLGFSAHPPLFLAYFWVLF